MKNYKKENKVKENLVSLSEARYMVSTLCETNSFADCSNLLQSDCYILSGNKDISDNLELYIYEILCQQFNVNRLISLSESKYNNEDLIVFFIKKDTKIICNKIIRYLDTLNLDIEQRLSNCGRLGIYGNYSLDCILRLSDEVLDKMSIQPSTFILALTYFDFVSPLESDTYAFAESIYKSLFINILSLKSKNSYKYSYLLSRGYLDKSKFIERIIYLLGR